MALPHTYGLRCGCSEFAPFFRSVPLLQLPCQWLGFQPSWGRPQERISAGAFLFPLLAPTVGWLQQPRLLRPSALGAEVPKALWAGLGLSPNCYILSPWAKHQGLSAQFLLCSLAIKRSNRDHLAELADKTPGTGKGGPSSD